MENNDNDRWREAISDLPFAIAKQLMDSMDLDKGWEKLAAQAGYKFNRIQLLSNEQQRTDGSPTRTLLWELNCQNYKLWDLYEKLRATGRRRELEIIEKYVNSVVDEGNPSAPRYSSLRQSLNSPQSYARPSLPHWTSRADQKHSKGYHSGGSEINFNHLSLTDKCKTDDKVIPGTNSQRMMSQNSMLPSDNLQEMLRNSYVSSSSNQTPPPPKLSPESSDRSFCSSSNNKSLSSGSSLFGLTGNSSGMNGSRSNSGVENIQKMLGAETSQSLTAVQELISSSSPHKPVTQSMDNNICVASGSSEEDFAMAVKATFTYAELSKATNNFSESKLLGEGAFGTVYLGSLRHLDCAIKVLNKTENESVDTSSQMKSELAALLKYRHENIVTLYGHTMDGPHLCLVYQYLENGSLEDRLSFKDNSPPLTWERRLNILVGATKGLNFLHTMGKKPLIHGDIKSANILLDKYMEAKIGDLGQAKYATSFSNETVGLTHITLAQSTTKLFGTKAYMSHDLLTGAQLSIKSDIYAFGVVLLEICSGLKAYDSDRNETFLAAYFTNIIMEKPEEERLQEFQDPSAPCVEVIFTDLLKCASKCVSQRKKLRPSSEKLLVELKGIYQKFIDSVHDDESLSSSLQIDSNQSCYQSNTSETKPSVDLIYENAIGPSWPQGSCSRKEMSMWSSIPHPSNNPMQNNPLPMGVSLSNSPQAMSSQALSTAQYSSTGMVHLSLGGQQQGRLQPKQQQCNVNNMSSLSPAGSGHVVDHSDEGQVSVRSPTGKMISTDNQYLPEALRLQAAYDRQVEKKKIDRLSGSIIRQQDVPLESKGRADRTGDSINVGGLSEQKSNGTAISYQSHPGGEIGMDLFPQADPKKMAELFAYDNEQNIVTNTAVESDLSCDPKKIAFLQEWDEEAYKRSDAVPSNQQHPLQTEETSYDHGTTCNTGIFSLESDEKAKYCISQAPHYGQEHPAGEASALHRVSEAVEDECTSPEDSGMHRISIKDITVGIKSNLGVEDEATISDSCVNKSSDLLERRNQLFAIYEMNLNSCQDGDAVDQCEDEWYGQHNENSFETRHQI